jgi:hypothetical protein
VTRGGLGEAARIVLGAPRLWGLALAGFLARGGIVLFVLPILVVPSVVGIVTFIGPDAVTAAGLSWRFLALVAWTSALLSGWLLLGLVVGVLVELALIEAVVPGPNRAGGLADDQPGGPASRRRVVVRLLVVRSVSLVPFGLAVAVASARLIDAGYQEMILPSDTSAPLVGRILLAAPDAIVLVAVGWLVSELEGAVAARLVAIEGRSAPASLVGAVGWVVRRPVRTAWIGGATAAASIVVLGLALAATSAAWALVRDALLGSPEPLAALVATLGFVAIWVAGLVLAGLVSAWRSVSWSLAVAGDHRGGGVQHVEGGTL